MDKTPPEILQQILHGVDAPLAPYATVCRRFQRAIEVRTFAAVRTYSTEASLEELDSVFKDQRRRFLVRELEFHVVLPDISKKRVKKLQSSREAAANNATFTKALHALFTRLQHWAGNSGDSEKAGSFHLAISSASPKDNYIPESPYNHETDPAWPIRNWYKYVELDGVQELPSLPFVTEYSDSGRRIHPSAVATIWQALPRISRLYWEHYTAPRRLEALKASLRESISSALVKPDFSRLEDLEIYHEDSDPLNHDWEPPNLLDSGNHDRLSLGVNRILRLPSLRKLKLTGTWILSPGVFDIDDGDANACKSLEDLELQVSMMTPSGEWYFTGDRASVAPSEERTESDSERSQAAFDSADSDASDFLPEFRWGKLDGDVPYVDYRHHPDPATINPFLAAMASAVVRMPALRTFECSFSRAALIRYWGPGQKSNHLTSEESNQFLDSALAHGRWRMDFDLEEHNHDSQNPVRSDWELPAELVQLLDSANHHVYLTRGNRRI